MTGITTTLRTSPASTASFAAAISLSANRRTGSSESAPSRSAWVMPFAARSSSLIGTA